MIKFLATLLIFTALNSFGDGNSKYDIGVVYWSKTIECQLLMRDGLYQKAIEIDKEAQAKNKRGINLIEQYGGDGEEGIKNQVSIMDNFIKEGVDALIVQPMDSAALKNSLLEANRKNIPVITYDGYIMGKGEIASYIVSDNFMLGYYDGEYIASMFENSKNLKIVILDYPYQQNAIKRVDGFITALEDNNQKYTILKTYISVEPKGAKIAAKNILNDFPQKDSIDVIFANNDGGSLEVVKALFEAKRDEIVFASIDGDPQSIENIKNDRLTVIDTAQFCAPLGEEAILQMYRLLEGERIPSKILLPVFPITKETLPLYPGWRGPIPQKFEKSWESKKSKEWDNSYKYEYR